MASRCAMCLILRQWCLSKWSIIVHPQSKTNRPHMHRVTPKFSLESAVNPACFILGLWEVRVPGELLCKYRGTLYRDFISNLLTVN